jgi:homoserine kinase
VPAGAAAVTVRVPASTANLGSGYDAFGLALARYSTVRAALCGPGEWSVSVDGEGAESASTGARNLVARSMAHLFREADERRGARITCVNGIPFGRGLGSSSAAIVGGLVAANELVGGPFDREALFRMAAKIEGHADNVAAALFGGFTICWSEDEGPLAARVDPPGGIAAVMVVSEKPLPTRRSRGLLPDSIPHADAAFSAGRAGLLATAIALGRRDLIGPGMSDRLHERYRSIAVPDLESVREVLLAAGADGAALSGAGPSVVGLVAGEDDREAAERAAGVAARATALLAGHPGRRAAEVLMLDREGATVLA